MTTTARTGAAMAGQDRPLRYAIAFGGGGARGLAHIHVISVLDELGIRPVAIAGTSIGAIMGAAMASGMRGAEIRDYALTTLGDRAALANRLLTGGPNGLRGAIGSFRFGHFDLERILDVLLPRQVPRDFRDLEIPLQISATDYYGEGVAVLDSGDLRAAIAASAAIPGLFMPVRVGGRVMIDGGIVDPVPYEKLMPLADVVIGVDVAGSGPQGDGSRMPGRVDNIVGAMQLSMRACISLKLRLGAPHILLKPPVDRFNALDFLRAGEILESTENIADELRRQLAALGRQGGSADF